jgi:hypothetical protein
MLNMNGQLDVMAGKAFSVALRAQQLPQGPLFINRFFHGDGRDWYEEWEDVRDSMSNAAALDESLRKLITMLDELAAQGAPWPVIGAAEEAVTLNLTGVAVQLGMNLVGIVPSLRSFEAFQEEGFPGWSDDPAIDSAAFLIREECSALDAAMLLRGERFVRRPGDALRAAIGFMRARAFELTTEPPEKIVALLGPLGSMDDSMVRHLGKMEAASKAIDKLTKSSYSGG